MKMKTKAGREGYIKMCESDRESDESVFSVMVSLVD